MKSIDNSFKVLTIEDEASEFAALTGRSVATPVTGAAASSVVTARFHGFDLEDHPLLTEVPGLPHEVVLARSTVPLLRNQIGASVVVVFEDGDLKRPIVVGVIREHELPVATNGDSQRLVTVVADDDSVLVSAERQITLKCGEASITLTRAGKVIITGTYILSRSRGYNKIKGAVVDIN
jgi:hypothetical protein